MRILQFFRKHWVFICIFLIAFFFRAYRLDVLTTFGRDQGIDFLTVKQMIETKKPTLLGIKVSIADFHQGPVYLYLLVPLFVLMNLHPLAGAVTTVIISLLSLVVLYVTVHRFFGKKAALWSSAIFAVSPELIREGNTPLYQHFLPFFLLLTLGAFLQLNQEKDQKKKIILMFCIGLFLGICLELHFLAITIVLGFLFYMIYRLMDSHFHGNDSKTAISLIKYISIYFFGLVIGVLPTLLFELRHEFLNTKLLLQFLFDAHSVQYANTNYHVINVWGASLSRLMGADQFWIGVIVAMISIFGICWFSVKNTAHKQIHRMFLATMSILFLFQLSLSTFEIHYLLPIWMFLIIFIPLWISELPFKFRNITYIFLGILLLGNALHMLSLVSANHGYDMPNGWSLRKMMITSEIIKKDAEEKEKINVASLLDGDTRTYPLRYVLNRAGVKVDSEEKYPESMTLYLVSSSDIEKVQNATVWEVDSLRPFEIGGEWDLGEGIVLYRLDKNQY